MKLLICSRSSVLYFTCLCDHRTWLRRRQQLMELFQWLFSPEISLLKHQAVALLAHCVWSSQIYFFLFCYWWEKTDLKPYFVLLITFCPTNHSSCTILQLPPVRNSASTEWISNQLRLFSTRAGNYAPSACICKCYTFVFASCWDHTVGKAIMLHYSWVWFLAHMAACGQSFSALLHL